MGDLPPFLQPLGWRGGQRRHRNFISIRYLEKKKNVYIIIVRISVIKLIIIITIINHITVSSTISFYYVQSPMSATTVYFFFYD